MVVTVGINGFGRIGRVIFRSCLQNTDIQILAINDPAVSVEYICYLIKFDSTHGKFCGNISNLGNELFVNGKSIKIFHYKQPSKIPWSSVGVQYVIEASGMFTYYDKASGHLSCGGIKRVLVTAPSVDVPMILLGINSEEFHPDVKVLSCASSTLYCLAPIIKILDDSYGVSEGFVTSIHAMTPSLKPLDGLCLRGKHWRDHRSIHQNIIPATTGACKALGKILPQVKDKLNGLAFRVPIVNVSVLDLTIRLNKPTSLQEIIKNVDKNTKLQNIIRISCDEAVSSDFVGESHSCILDANSSLELSPNFYKLICWYENEYSYACRVIDTIIFSEEHISNISNPIKECLTYNKETLSHTNYSNNKYKESMTSQNKCNSSSAVLNKHSSVPKTDITSGKADCKGQYEHFKIWNDDNQTVNIRQNKSSFFHSCKSFSPKCTIHASTLKAHEKFEKIKQEFSNLGNITDNILRKSSLTKNKKVQSTSKPIVCNIVKDGGCINSNFLKTVTNCIKFHSGPASDVSSDFRNSCGHSNDNNMVVPTHIREINQKIIHNDNTLGKKTNTPIKLNSTEKENDIIKTSDYLNMQAAKSFNIFLNEIQPDMQRPHSWSKLHKGVSVHKPKNDDKSTQQNLRKNDKESKMCSTENNMESTSDPMRFVIRENHNENLLNDKSHSTSPCPKYFENTFSKIGVLSEELKKRNIVTSSYDSSDLYQTESEKNSMKDTKFEKKMDELNNLNKDSSIDDSKNPYKYASPSYTNTTISNGDRRTASHDIYDKLDSTSASDSENSFQIHERKSQIINIQDLTSSLDDLVRLDKICRIIEISDDLSNELFSSLDKNDDSLNENKWSFRDLCEKIKLDEFCDRIFGKSTL